ncbi:MAG: hypothetical protein M3429_03925 [Verrucomicrobiota bacterium]|nr:hypothetical protein [Verrucomicrobiota bacterium]
MNSNQDRLPGGRFVWLVVAFFSLAPAFAGEIVVTNPGDQPVPGKTSLREAISASAPNDVITFAVDQQIILTEGELVIDHNLELRGPDVGKQDIRWTDGIAFRLFTISSGTVTFSRLTLRNGYDSTVDVVTSPAANARGGAISNAGTLHLTDCFFYLNSVNAGQGLSDTLGETGGNGEGGAIYNSGTLTVLGCTFNSSHAAGGHGGEKPQRPGRVGGRQRRRRHLQPGHSRGNQQHFLPKLRHWSARRKPLRQPGRRKRRSRARRSHFQRRFARHLQLHLFP